MVAGMHHSCSAASQCQASLGSNHNVCGLPLQELAVIALLSYLSYLLADVTGLSGILSLFVCGVVVSHYALHNISEEGRGATLTGFRTASYLAEGIIFIYVGMDALDPLKWQVRCNKGFRFRA